MLSCVMPNSPFTSELHTNNSFGLLTEESFDTSFSFLNPETMEYYIASPDSGNEENNNMPRVIPSQISPPSHVEQDNHHDKDVDMSPAEGNMSHLSLHSPIDPAYHTEQLDNYPYTYAPYPIPYQQNLLEHTSHFHPYRPYGGVGLRSPKFVTNAAEPLSPPVSLSPPGSSSSGRQHQALLNTPPTAVSPTMVSPASALSDLSPQNIGWSYPLPHVPGGGQLYGAHALGGINQMSHGSPHSGLAMVQGFPYTTSPIKASGPARSMRPRIARRITSGSSTVKKEKSDDDLIDSDDEGDESVKGVGLGLTPLDATEGRITVSAKREDVRKARIESEQRRRDELREGFKRLKDALPPSNQRASKSSLLDRSVTHIEQVQSANRYLLAQLEAANAELTALRATNQELVHAVSMHTRAGTGSSPGSNTGKA